MTKYFPSLQAKDQFRIFAETGVLLRLYTYFSLSIGLVSQKRLIHFIMEINTLTLTPRLVCYI